MAYIRTYTTAHRNRRSGKPVKRYEVVWREQAKDANGLPTRATRARQESYATRQQAEVRRDELNAAKHTPTGTTALADAKKAGARTYGEYATAWLDTQRLKVMDGKLKEASLEDYQQVLCKYPLERFGDRAIGAITSLECEAWLAELAAQGLSRESRRKYWRIFRAVLRYAKRHGAIPVDPSMAIERGSTSAVGDGERFVHRPLTAAQVATFAAKVGERYAVYELLVLFMAYTGLRAAEAQGLEVRDLTLTTGPGGATRGSVRVQRIKQRRHREWETNTPKSKRSKRTVPLPPWLATKLAAYLADTHPAANNPTAVLWPRRLRGGTRTKGMPSVATLDWAEPCDFDGLHAKVLRPALAAVGLEGTRLHDLRHTFAALQLSAGVHFMQVSKWLGHAQLHAYAGRVRRMDPRRGRPEHAARTGRTRSPLDERCAAAPHNLIPASPGSIAPRRAAQCLLYRHPAAPAQPGRESSVRLSSPCTQPSNRLSKMLSKPLRWLGFEESAYNSPNSSGTSAK